MSNDVEVFSAVDLALLARGEGPLKPLHPPARLAIFGDPVAHSASPMMQNAALRERGLDLQYVRIRVTPEELPDALANLSPAGFLGVSLTIPHKQTALPFMDEVSGEARLMGAINTVIVRDGKLYGHNTDAPGLSTAVAESFSRPISALRILILGGAGGAGRAITIQCVLEKSPSVTIANRHSEKGTALASEIRDSMGAEVHSIPLAPEDLRMVLASTDLIINATPLGMKAGDPSPLPEGVLDPDHLVYDTVYGTRETALLKQAREAGTRCADGFSMLLHQGSLQNALWFGEPTPVDAMRKSLKDL